MNPSLKKSILFFSLIYQAVFYTAQTCSLTVVATSYSVCPGFNTTITAFGATSYTWTSPGLVSPIFSQSVAVPAGNYKVKGSTGNCVDSTNIAIGFFNPLLINLLANPSLTTCLTSNQPAGSKPVILTASGAITYSWSSNVPQVNMPATGAVVIVAPTSSSCYTVEGKTNVCWGYLNFCLNVKPQFPITLAPSQASVCIGSSIAIAVNNVSQLATGPASLFTYSWSEPPGLSLMSNNTATVAALPQANTIYTAQVFDANGCVSTMQTATVLVNPCLVGIEDSDKLHVEFYFNSYENTVCVKTNDEIQLQVFNLSGSLVYKKTEIQPGSHVLNIDPIPEGIYIVRLTGNQGENHIKIFKPNY